MGYRRLSARPRHHAQAAGAIVASKAVSPRVWTRSGARRVSIPAPQRSGSPTKPVSARRTKIARRWAKRGTRPSAPQDQRTASTCILGAICPATGHHHCPASGKMPGAEPRRERLAVHARQPAGEPGVRLTQRHCRSLLLSVELPHGSAMACHEHRTTAMGASSCAMNPGITRCGAPASRYLNNRVVSALVVEIWNP